MHHCEEGSHCVFDLLIGWLGSMVPWTSFGYRCHHIPVLPSTTSPPHPRLCFPFLCFYGIHCCLHHQHRTCRCTRMVHSRLRCWQLLHCLSPLFASAAPLGNWALYRVGLNVLSYVGALLGLPPLPNNSSSSINTVCLCDWVCFDHCTSLDLCDREWCWWCLCSRCCFCPSSSVRHCNLHLCCNCK